MRRRSIWRGWADDARRGFVAATGALLAIAIAELFSTMVAYSGPLHTGAVARFVLLDLTLVALLWMVVAPLIAAAYLVPRLITLCVRGRVAARALPGPGARPLSGAAVAHGWPLLAAAVLYVQLSSNQTLRALAKYKERDLMSLLLAVQQVVLLAVLIAAALFLGALLDRARRFTDRHLGRWRWLSPIGSIGPALLLVGGMVVAVLSYKAHKMPPLRPLVPWRYLLDLGAALAGAGLIQQWARRATPRWPKPRRRKVALAIAGVAVVIVPLTLVRMGGHPDTKFMAITGSPLLNKMVDYVRKANDFDGDGFGSLLGENDCAPFNKKVGPAARDLPDNGIDENCDGRDPSLRDLIAPEGDHMPVPAAFQRDWNVLLITVDTLRYDHTSFGGYRDGPKGRDTTPRLNEMVEQAVSFTFANAPSAGTMASIPAILTSKFFHSGIALDEKRKPKMPPKLKAENWTLPEVMKREGYHTGAILSHEYFNDWGMKQGVDEYDNEIGKKPDAKRISSHLTTDRALAWVSRNVNKKWFLWLHYLDPHGHYVDHPEQDSYGTSEEDLYDGELRYTDAHLGRLFTQLKHLPGASNTIIIITSDHGDAFGEHGFTNHGQELYRELLHVPLIIYVPDVPAREIPGAVTPLDILPTIADLCGIDVSDLTFEGRSLVPQIFYEGTADLERVVFAETNYPKPLRAAISADYKLIHDLANNLTRLYRLETDPWEKTNLASKDPQGLALMKGKLDDWLQRVMFSRDATFNQAIGKVADVLLTKPPSPVGGVVTGTTLDGGRIEVLGWDPDPASAPYKPGEKVSVFVYFKVNDTPTGTFKLQLQGWVVDRATFDPKAAAGKRMARSSMRITAEGYLPTDSWRPGEYIRERFNLTLPADWAGDPGDAMALAVSMSGNDGKVVGEGQVAAGDPHLVVLGAAPLVQPPPPPEPPAPAVDAGIPGSDAGVQLAPKLQRHAP